MCFCWHKNTQIFTIYNFRFRKIVIKTVKKLIFVVSKMEKQQRIMIDGGFTCPNRDGSRGRGGCTYCRNDSFAPDYCRRVQGIASQVEAGKEFFRGRYPQMRYLAYFQSYSGTYAPVSVLRQRYEEALSAEGVVGLVIATRPDCLQDDVLDLLEELAGRVPVTVEIGVESCHDHVLRRINRGHTFREAEDAIRRTKARGLTIGVHIILGLPEETDEEMLRGAELLSDLPIDYLKLHQLQILRDTPMAEDFRQHPEDFRLFPTAEDYVAFVRQYRRHLRADIAIERYVSFASPSLVICPRWGLKPVEIEKMIKKNNL